MSVVYTRAYKVPTWILVDVSGYGRYKMIVSLLEQAGNIRKVEWPDKDYVEHIKSYRHKGYNHILSQEMPYFADPSFLVRATGSFMKEAFGPRANLSSSISHIARLNRNISNVDDYAPLLEEIVSLEDDMALSVIFEIAEKCHNEYQNQSVWVSDKKFPKKLLTRLANKIIVIGDSASSDLVVKGLTSKEELATALNTYFTGE